MEKRSHVLYERFLAIAKNHLESNKIEDAERAFASALRHVYMRKNKAYETAIALRGLGYVYKARGKVQKSGEDLVKASGLFISSLNRLRECHDNCEGERTVKATRSAVSDSDIINLQEEIKSVHTIFIEQILQSQQDGKTIDFQRHEQYKDSLEKIREYCQSQISSLDSMPPLQPDTRDVNIEKVRIDLIQDLHTDIRKSMNELITRMVDDCMQIMPSPPCNYSILGLGSTARGEATPYSDLEFCILVKKNSDDVMQYFTNFTNFLHLKVVELGETILHTLGIKSLNDYYSRSKEDDWFYDDGPRGFSFDGAMPWASKTPKGRDKTFNKPWVQSLIKTPQDMADLLSETSIFKKGYHVADVLSKCSLICGDYSLFEDYNNFMREYINDTLSACNCTEASVGSKYHVNPMPWKQRILQELFVVKKEYHNSLGDHVRRPGASYAIKRDVYRFPTLVIDYVGEYFDIQCASSWKTVDELKLAKILSSEAAHNLRTALGIAAELRLRTYVSNRCQTENLNTLWNFTEDVPDNLSLLLRFFSTVVPLEEAIDKASSESLCQAINTEFYSYNPKIRAQIYLQFRMYSKAEQVLKDMLINKTTSNSKDEEVAEICKLLGNALHFLNKYSEASKFHKMALEINVRLYRCHTKPSNFKCLGDSYTNYGADLRRMGHFKEALFCHTKALEIRTLLFEECPTTVDQIFYLQDIADAHYNLSKFYGTDQTRPDLRNFLRHNHLAVDIAKILFEQYNLTYYHYPMLLFDQGLVYYDLQMFEESAKAYQEALELVYHRIKYNISTEKEATLLNNLGNAVIELGDFQKARNLHNRAYEIRTRIYGTKDKDCLARSLNNFGLINENEGNFKEAYKFYSQARDMSLRIHGEESHDKHLQLYRRNAERMAEKCQSEQRSIKCVII